MMRRRASGTPLALMMMLSVARAGAQEAPAMPSTDAMPPPHPTVGRPAGTTRLSLRSFDNTTRARLYVARTPGGPYSIVCEAPCEADVVPGTPLRVTLGDAEEGHDFTMRANAGSDLDVEVRPASNGALAGGIVMTSVGALTVFGGLVGLLVASIGSTGGRVEGLPAYICIALGVGLFAGGIVVIKTRSQKPRLNEAEHDRTRDENATSKTALFVGDVATLRTAEPISTMFTPLTWGLTF